MAIFTVQNYGDRIMQFLTTCYNLEFRKLTLYGITRPQSIRKIETNLWANDFK